MLIYNHQNFMFILGLKMSRNIKLGLEQEIQCLELIGRFDFLRLQEISLFLWPTDPLTTNFYPDEEDNNRYHYAQSLVKKLVEKDLVFTQKLPQHAGTAVVLKKAGVEIVKKMGYKKVKLAKLFDDDSGNQCWKPRPTWRHDLMIPGFAARAFVDPLFLGMSKNRLIFKTEKEQMQVKPTFNNSVRDVSEKATKFTDLLIEHQAYGVVGIEFERSRKNGEKRNAVIENFIQTNKSDGCSTHNFDGMEPKKIAFAYNPDEMERTKAGGYKKIDHFSNIYNATVKNMKEVGLEEMHFIFYELQIKNFGVVGFKLNQFHYNKNMDPTL